MRLYGQGLAQVALGEDLDPAAMSNEAAAAQRLRCHLGALVEDLESSQVDDGELLLVRVVEPGKLGDPHRERGLSTLEPGTQRVASLEAFRAAPGGLPPAATLAPTHPDPVLLRPGGRLEMVEFELFFLLFGHQGSSTSIMCRTLCSIPRMAV